ncbi:MAG: hypothetical protein WKF84_02065 [Pyrinomonadaceae bacterium]
MSSNGTAATPRVANFVQNNGWPSSVTSDGSVVFFWTRPIWCPMISTVRWTSSCIGTWLEAVVRRLRRRSPIWAGLTLAGRRARRSRPRFVSTGRLDRPEQQDADRALGLRRRLAGHYGAARDDACVRASRYLSGHADGERRRRRVGACAH